MLNENKFERALLVLDMLYDFTHREGRYFTSSALDIVPFVEGEIQYFRERMRPVIFCNSIDGYDFTKAHKHGPVQHMVQSLIPRASEISIKTSRPNAFFNTVLAKVLNDLKVRKLTIVGLFTHTSVLLTAGSALDHGLSVVVPETCVCSRNIEDHLASLRLINRWLNG